MLCESCQGNEATVHLTQVVEGEVKKLHLCEACAIKGGLDVQSPLSLSEILLGLGQVIPPAGAAQVCPRCGLRPADFKRTGRLGCPECYEAFARELMPLLKSMHKGDRHIGKGPDAGTLPVMPQELERLQRELQEAIGSEQFEKAARLRDRIQALKKGEGQAPA